MLKSLPRNVVMLGLVSLLTDLASEMCLPLFPLLLAGMGRGAAFLGLLEGMADAISALLKYASGSFSDRLPRRKPLVLLGYTLATLARPLNGLSTLPIHVLLLRGLDRVGKGIRSAPRDALIADSVAPEGRGAAFGFHRSMDHAGAVLGPLVAVAILAGHSDLPQIRLAFLLSLIPGLGAVLCLWLGVKEVPHAPAPTEKQPSTPAPPQAALPGARLLLATTAVFAAFRLQEVLLLSRLHALGAPALALPLAWSGLHVVKTLTGGPMGAWADRVGRERTLVLGYVVYAVTVLLCGLAPTMELLIGAMLLYGLHAGLVEGVEKALVSECWPKRARGRGFGFYHAITALSAMPAGFAQGWILENASGAWMGGVLATGAMVACAFAVAFARMRRRG
ncbi:MAG: MFS transporter [Myxococcota bacterium]